MKSYENKKFYNFKKKHKRKKRTRDARHFWKIGSADYLLEKRQTYRTKCKVILEKKLNGEELEFPLYRKTLWWDS